MLEWLLRGVSRPRATLQYPKRTADPPIGFAGQIQVLDTDGASGQLERLCPTGAISVADSRMSVDRGRCILCGECVREAPERFAFGQRFESAERSRSGLVVGDPPHTGSAELAPRMPLGDEARPLRRSIHVRHIDTGSDGAEEWEIHALWNPVYDIQRLGFFLVASPRHADLLVVTGGVCKPMREPLLRTWDVMPAPKALVAVGTDACSGGLAREMGLTAGGVDAVLPVDVYVPGSPPAPIAILDGFLQAVGQLTVRDRIAG